MDKQNEYWFSVEEAFVSGGSVGIDLGDSVFDCEIYSARNSGGTDWRKVMSDRATLHFEMVVPFSIWLEKNGWSLQLCKGQYEILRMTKPWTPALIVHAKADARKHATLHGESTKWFWRWKSDRERFKDSPLKMNADDKNCMLCAHRGDGDGENFVCKRCRCYTKFHGAYDLKSIRVGIYLKEEEA